MRTRLLVIALVAAATPALCAAQAGDVADGEATFKAICAACHTTAPPPKLAPPMVMVSRHYRAAFATDSAGHAALVAFISAPDTLRMTLPRHANQRFGYMPRLPLTARQVHDVAAYVWSLSAAPADAAAGAPQRATQGAHGGHGPPGQR